MRADPRPAKLDMRKEMAELRSKPTVIGGIIAFLIVLGCVPTFLILLPFVIVFLVILYKIAEGNNAKARAIADKHLGGRSTELDLLESVATASALVLNDWGIVYFTPGKAPIEWAWKEIDSIEETGIGVLRFSNGRTNFEVNLSIHRYMLINEVLTEKLPAKTHFDVDVKTGKSKLLDRLKTEPRRWPNNLILTNDGIEFNTRHLPWNDISSVRESVVSVEDASDQLTLTFSSSKGSFDIPDYLVSRENELPRYTGYDLLGAIVAERLPNKTNLSKPALTPAIRALHEFERCHEAMAAAYSLAAEKGNFQKLEPQYKYMLDLVDKFHLDHVTEVQKFFHDYAYMLQKLNRPDDAAKLQRRMT